MGQPERERSWSALTDRERRVAAAVGAGSANKAIARELGISIKTVEFHLGNAYRKLGVDSRLQLANLLHSMAAGDPSVPQGNLPRERSALVGSDRLVDHIVAAIATWPMVTLTGVGGVGKTRLALEVGRRATSPFADGSWIVELATVSAGRDVATACADALGLQTRSAAAPDDVALALGRQRRLVILDNCEHVIDAAASLAEAMLRWCPHVTVLATSRQRLGVADERVIGVPTLSVDRGPGPSPAEQLFVERAGAVLGPQRFTDDELDVVHELCRRLDGLPLAIELAAARLGGLTLGQIHERLDDRFGLLVRRRIDPGRHHSLAAAVEWSYDLLSEGEQQLLSLVSVLPGEFDVATALAIAEPGHALRSVEDLLGSLVEKSLVIASDRRSVGRFTLLETVREFAHAEIVRRGAEGAALRRHLEHVRAELGHINAELRGPDELPAHLAMLDQWHHVRLAMSTACELDDGAAACALIDDVLWWALTRVRAEVGDWAERVRGLPSTVDLPARTVATAAAAFFAYMRGEMDSARHLIGEARSEEHRWGELTDPWVPVVETFLADDQVAMATETQRRAQRCGSRFWEAVGILQEAVIRSYDVAHATNPVADRSALARIDDAIAMAEAYGNPNGIAYGAANLAEALIRTEPERAEALLVRAIETAAPLGLELLVGQSRRALATVLGAGGRPVEALHVMASALRASIRCGAFVQLRVELAICVDALESTGAHDLADLVVAVVGDGDLADGGATSEVTNGAAPPVDTDVVDVVEVAMRVIAVAGPAT